MDKKAENILIKYKNKKAAVFIDDANMFHAQREIGWYIDWKKFKYFLEDNFKVKFIRYYRGIYPKSEKIEQKVKQKHENYAKILKRLGIDVVQRFLKKIYLDKEKTKFIYKCDFDAEIGYDIALNLEEIDLVILVSGDSDFTCFSNKLLKQKKNFLIMCFNYKAPWEFRRIHHIFLEDIKESIIFQKKTRP